MDQWRITRPKVRDGAGEQELPRIEEEHLRRHREHQSRIVARQDCGAPQAGNKADEIPAQNWVECGECFVQKQVRRIGRKRTGNGKPLLFATAQFAGKAARVIRREVDRSENSFDVDTGAPGKSKLIGGAAMWEQPQVLRNETNGAAQRKHILRADVLPADHETTFVEFREPIGQPQQRALTRATTPEQKCKPTRWRFRANRMQHRLTAAAGVYVVEANQFTEVA